MRQFAGSIVNILDTDGAELEALDADDLRSVPLGLASRDGPHQDNLAGHQSARHGQLHLVYSTAHMCDAQRTRTQLNQAAVTAHVCNTQRTRTQLSQAAVTAHMCTTKHGTAQLSQAAVTTHVCNTQRTRTQLSREAVTAHVCNTQRTRTKLRQAAVTAHVCNTQHTRTQLRQAAVTAHVCNTQRSRTQLSQAAGHTESSALSAQHSAQKCCTAQHHNAARNQLIHRAWPGPPNKVKSARRRNGHAYFA